MRFVLILALVLNVWASPAAAFAVTPTAKDVLHIFNWSDYIGATTLDDFTRATGIKVVYDTYGSNEEMEARLAPGHSGYDIVVPTATPYFARLVQRGQLLPLDKARIPNLKNLDPALMQGVQRADPGNRYGIIYAWGTSGLGLNLDLIKARMPTAPLRSWDMVFKPDVVKKFADCGVTILNSGFEVLPSVLAYLGLDPLSEKPEDLQAAERVMQGIKPYVRRFDSANYIDDLAQGRLCLVLGWSGDVLQAKARAVAAGKGVRIDYNVPQEGSQMWFDMMGVLRDAPNPAAAWQFINFILDPANMAKITDTVAYANAVPASLPQVTPEVRGDADIFPTEAMRRRLFVVPQADPNYEKLRQRVWERLVESP